MFFRFIPAMLVISIAAVQPAKAQLGARQLFYDEGSEKKKPAVAKPPATPPKPAPAKKAAAPKTKPVEKGDPIRLLGPPLQVSQEGMTSVQVRPLALRCSIWKVLTPGESIEVDADTSFRTGDQIQVLVEGNQAGYLYIFSQGSSGTWRPLFPAMEVADGDNRVRGRQAVMLPSDDHVITFSGKPGMEKLFVLFSRNPNEDVDKLIYQQKNNSRTMLASVPIRPSEVDRIKLQSRDLVVESIKEKSVASAKPKAGSADRMSESAMYVATNDLSPKATVVAEILLKHE